MASQDCSPDIPNGPAADGINADVVSLVSGVIMFLTHPSTHHPRRSRRGIALLTALSAVTLSVQVVSVAHAAVGPDTAVTVDSSYVKANGRTPAAGDAISSCGTNLRQQ